MKEEEVRQLAGLSIDVAVVVSCNYCIVSLC